MIDDDVIFFPEREIIFSAIRFTEKGFPISYTNKSPELPVAVANKTISAACLTDIKKRFITGCVTVKGTFFWICRSKTGITEPLEPMIFPKRVMTNRVGEGDFFLFNKKSSAQRLDLPIIPKGCTALSVEIFTKTSQLWF